uniref:Cadherin domain-containing protein n=1 Tax=Xiphophorus couchianus TaxID=32473 RepID=A0A3B5KZJ5_9TELE
MSSRRNNGILFFLAMFFASDWSAAQISYSITEEADKGTVVGNLAKDLNVNVRDLQTRNLNIVSARTTITLTLTATDGGRAPKSGTVKIIINVLDANDNTPSFGKSLYKARVYENAPVGSTVIQLNATDLDEGENARVIYSLVKRASFNPAEIFSMNSETGAISIKSELDYETHILFYLKACDIHSFLENHLQICYCNLTSFFISQIYLGSSADHSLSILYLLFRGGFCWRDYVDLYFLLTIFFNC